MIRTTDDGDLRVVTIDRPARRNALRPTDLDALEAAVTGTDAPVVLLRRNGPVFCVGVDLDSVTDPDDPEAFVKHGQRVVDAVESVESVVAAGIDRAARGGGVEPAFTYGVRVATPRVTLGEPSVRLDLFGAWGGTVRLPRIVGGGHVLEFSLSGCVVNVDEALRMGFAPRIADDPGKVAVSMVDNNHRSFQIVKKQLCDRGNRDGRLERETVGSAELHRVNIDDIVASREK